MQVQRFSEPVFETLKKENCVEILIKVPKTKEAPRLTVIGNILIVHVELKSRDDSIHYYRECLLPFEVKPDSIEFLHDGRNLRVKLQKLRHTDTLNQNDLHPL